MSRIEITVGELRKRKLMVATPMYGGQCFGSYMKSSLDLVGLCAKYKIQCQFQFIFNESLVQRARNYLAHEFLCSDATHLMFIDSDIEYNPKDVLAMLAMDKDILAGPYPKKTLSCEKLYDAVKLGLVDDNPNLLERYVGDYVFNCVPGTTEMDINTPSPVLEAGTGFLMIRRNVLEKFRESYPELAYLPDHNRTERYNGSSEIWSFFDTRIDPESKRYLSEDYFFCQWARKIGFEIMLCPWMHLKHSGSYTFGGSMAAMATLSHAQVAAGGATPVMRSLNDKVKELVKPLANVNPNVVDMSTQIHPEEDETCTSH